MTGLRVSRPILRLGIVAAFVGLFLLNGAAGGPIYLDDPPAPTDPATTGTTPQRVSITSAALSCPGPEQLGLSDATVTESLQTVLVHAVTAPGEVLDEGSADAASGELTLTAGEAPSTKITGRAEVVSQSVDTADLVTLVATGTLAPALSAAQLWLGSQEQQVGLSFTPCHPPVESGWLIAGGAQPGRAERLVLLNPGRTPISVDLQVWGSAGSGTDDIGSQVALAPGERRIVLLDALAPGVETPAVLVQTTGGPVTAYLGDRWLKGTADQGWDLSAPAANPATSHILPGILAPQGAGSEQDPESAPSPVIVRVAVPGSAPAVVSVQGLTDQGAVDLPTDVALVPGQQSTDIEIADLPDGTSALRVDSDEPVVAAAQLSTSPSAQGRQDIAWSPAASPLGGVAGAPLPQLGDDAPELTYRLHLVAPAGGRATVYTLSIDDEIASTDLDLSVDAPTEVLLADARAVWVETTAGEVYGSVSAQGVVPVSDEDPTAGSPTATADDDEASPEVDDVPVLAVLPLVDLPRYRSLIDLVPQRP